MTTICAHGRQLCHCAECAPAAESRAMLDEVAKQCAEMYEAGRKMGRAEAVRDLVFLAENEPVPERQQALVNAAKALMRVAP